MSEQGAYPSEVDRIALLDAFLPGVGNWRDVWLLRDLWHFHFYGETPLALMDGRERIYFEHFWNDFAADRTRSVPEGDRRFYAEAYARPGGMRAGFEIFRAFERDAEEFARFAQTSLSMPLFVLTGEKASGDVLIQQARLVAGDVEGVRCSRRRALADGRSPGSSHPQARPVPRSIGGRIARAAGCLARGPGARPMIAWSSSEALPLWAAVSSSCGAGVGHPSPSTVPPRHPVRREPVAAAAVRASGAEGSRPFSVARSAYARADRRGFGRQR